MSPVFAKCLNFNVEFKNAQTNSEGVFLFEIISSQLVALNGLHEADNACHRQSLCSQKLLRSFVSLKETFSKAITFTVISKYAKGASFRLQQCSDPFAMCLPKDPLKHGFLDIYLAMFFVAGISANTSAMRVIFFLANVQNLIYILKVPKKIYKRFSVFEIIASELVAFNCLY